MAARCGATPCALAKRSKASRAFADEIAAKQALRQGGFKDVRSMAGGILLWELTAGRRLFQLREEIASLDEQVAAYLASPRGLFELWEAERRRPR